MVALQTPLLLAVGRALPSTTGQLSEPSAPTEASFYEHDLPVASPAPVRPARGSE